MKENKKYNNYSKNYENIVQNFLSEDVKFLETNDSTKKEEIKLNKFLLLKLLIISLIILILSYSYYVTYNSYFFGSNEKKIKVAFYNNFIKYGGLERVTSILL